MTLCEDFDGNVTVLSKGRALSYRLLEHGEPPIPIEEKSIHGRIDQIKQQQAAKPAYKPPPDHPWRHAYPDRIT